MKRMLRFGLICATFCANSVPAKAGVIYNNFGTGYAYDCCQGWTVSGPGSSIAMEFQVAHPFTAAMTGTVSQIDVALHQATGDGGATVSLWTDGGLLPGSQLGSWNVTALPGFETCCAVVTISGLGSPYLVAGHQYFIVVAADQISREAWNWNSTGVSGVNLYYQSGSWHSNGYRTLGAFDILGVPEPTTTVLVGVGLLVLACSRRRAVR